MIVDSHAHLDSPALRDDLEAILERARKAGVELIMTVACARRETESFEEVLRLTEQYPRIRAAVGVHPHDATHFDESLETRIADLMRRPQVLAWGEIGLDYYYDNSPRDVQARAFRRQLKAARKAGKPVVVHSRDAAEDTCSILEEFYRDDAGPAGVMHCFTYDQATAERCLDLGFYLSFGGILTFPRSEQMRRVARTAPSDRYLIETDSPYLSPVPFRGKTNEPARVVKVAEKIAEVRGISLQQAARESTENFQRLFKFKMAMP